MSIIVNNLSYIHPDREPLFSGVSFSVPDGAKASLVGDNGSGKSTLLAILTRTADPSSGSVSVGGSLWHVPQHFGNYENFTIAQALGISDKLDAIAAIMAGDLSEKNYIALADDWSVAQRAAAALSKWDMGGFGIDTPFPVLSGGEKTRVFLAGIDVHSPGVVVMDEPTNHLDRIGRERVYEMVRSSRATMLIVSHDRELLSIPEITLELTAKAVERYGGNYGFYKEIRDGRIEALREQIGEKEKAMKAAKAKAQAVMERKQRSDSRSVAKHVKKRTLPGKVDKMRGQAEQSAARLRGMHGEKMAAIAEEKDSLKKKLPKDTHIKIALDDASLHAGKGLVTAEQINFKYPGGEALWKEPLTLRIASGERISLTGGNGSGKTTLLKLILGELEPTAGRLTRAQFSHIYVDQEYSMIDNDLTVYGQLQKYNRRNLPERMLKTELARFMFPPAAWDKLCSRLSGGEKMKLILCCLLVSNDMPDMFVLDEPTNNLDIRSMEILTEAVAGYKGTVLVISHDRHFLDDIGVTRNIHLQ